MHLAIRMGEMVYDDSLWNGKSGGCLRFEGTALLEVILRVCGINM